MHWFTTCDCCGRSSLLPAFTITEAGSSRRYVICVRCAPHVALRDNGAIAFGASCPEHNADNSAQVQTATGVADYSTAPSPSAAVG